MTYNTVFVPRKTKAGIDYDRTSYKKYDPEKYNQIIELRKEGKSYNQITAITGAAPNTISRICHENADELKAWKNRVSSKLGEAIDLLSDRLITEADNVSLSQIPVSIAIAIDKKAALDGENVSHVIHHKGLTHSDLGDKLDQMRQANVINVDNQSSETGPNIEQTDKSVSKLGPETGGGGGLDGSSGEIVTG